MFLAKGWMGYQKERTLKWHAKLRNTCPQCFLNMKQSNVWRFAIQSFKTLLLLLVTLTTMVILHSAVTEGYAVRAYQNEENCAIPSSFIFHMAIHHWIIAEKGLLVEHSDMPIHCEDVIDQVAVLSSQTWHQTELYIDRDYSELEDQALLYANFSKFPSLSRTYKELALETLDHIYQSCAVKRSPGQFPLLQSNTNPTLDDFIKRTIKHVQASACYVHDRTSSMAEKMKRFENYESYSKSKSDETLLRHVSRIYNMTEETWSPAKPLKAKPNVLNYDHGGWKLEIAIPESARPFLESIFTPDGNRNNSMRLTYWEWSSALANWIPAELRKPVLDLLMALDRDHISLSLINNKLKALENAQRYVHINSEYGTKILNIVARRFLLKDEWLQPSVFRGFYNPCGLVWIMIYSWLMTGLIWVYFFRASSVDQNMASQCIFCGRLFIPKGKVNVIKTCVHQPGYSPEPVEYQEETDSGDHRDSSPTASGRVITRLVLTCTWCDDEFVPKPLYHCKECKKNKNAPTVSTYCCVECLSAHWQNGHKECPHHRGH